MRSLKSTCLRSAALNAFLIVLTYPQKTRLWVRFFCSQHLFKQKMLSLIVLFGAALAIPLTVPLNYLPVASVYNDALSLILWGVITVALRYKYRSQARLDLVCAPASGPQSQSGLAGRFTQLKAIVLSPRGGVWVLAAFGVVFAIQIVSGAYGFISQMLLALAGAVAAWLVFDAGVRASQNLQADVLAKSFALALLSMGIVVSVLGWVQYFLPNVNSDWINPLATAGRVYGNLRQPNHLALVLVWAVWATVWLIGASRHKTGWYFLGLLLIVPVLVFTGSRMGLLLLVLLIPLAAVSQNPKSTLTGVGAALAIAAVSWTAAYWAAEAKDLSFYGKDRLLFGNATGGRLNLWLDVLAMLPQLPLNGCGVGQFGPCFIHADLPIRRSGIFENGHNLVLNGLVEWGWLLTGIIIVWLTCGLKVFFQHGLKTAAVLPAGMFISSLCHSMLEYPWWYPYLLLPTAFCFGWMWNVSAANKAGIALVKTDSVSVNPSSCSKVWGALLLAAFGVIYAVQYYPLRVMFSAQFFQKTTPVDLQAISKSAPLFSAPLSYALVISLSENVKKEDAKQLLPFFKLAGRGTVAPEFIARFSGVAALANERDMAKHLAWRVYSFDNEKFVTLRKQVTASNDPDLEWFVTYLKSPTPVNLDRRIFNN